MTGRNCKIGVDLRPEDFASSTLTSGETVEDRSFAHGWERELARAGSIISSYARQAARCVESRVALEAHGHLSIRRDGS